MCIAHMCILLCEVSIQIFCQILLVICFPIIICKDFYLSGYKAFIRYVYWKYSSLCLISFLLSLIVGLLYINTFFLFSVNLSYIGGNKESVFYQLRTLKGGGKIIFPSLHLVCGQRLKVTLMQISGNIPCISFFIWSCKFYLPSCP